MVTIQFKKLTPLATVPTRGSDFAAGYDLYATEEYTLQPLERKLFKTNLAFAIPSGLYGRIAPRSGLAFKNGLDVMAGVIDEDYRSDVGVILINLSNEPVKLPLMKDGKVVPIAQIIFENYAVATFQESDELPASVRGEGGFGSTDGKVGFFTTYKAVVNNSERTVTGTIVGDAATHKPTGDGKVPDKVPLLTSAVKVAGLTQGKSLAELYQKDGGVPIKKRYIDEIKERDKQ